MNVLREIYRVFVEDVQLALAGLGALAMGGLLAQLGWARWAGLPVVFLVAWGLWRSVLRG